MSQDTRIVVDLPAYEQVARNVNEDGSPSTMSHLGTPVRAFLGLRPTATPGILGTSLVSRVALVLTVSVSISSAKAAVEQCTECKTDVDKGDLYCRGCGVEFDNSDEDEDDGEDNEEASTTTATAVLQITDKKPVPISLTTLRAVTEVMTNTLVVRFTVGDVLLWSTDGWLALSNGGVEASIRTAQFVCVEKDGETHVVQLARLHEAAEALLVAAKALAPGATP